LQLDWQPDGCAHYTSDDVQRNPGSADHGGGNADRESGNANRAAVNQRGNAWFQCNDRCQCNRGAERIG